MEKFIASNFGREQAATVEINTIGFAELCKMVGADGLQPFYHAKQGSKIFLTKGGQRVLVDGKPFSAIRLGAKVNLNNDIHSEDPKEALEGLKELINNNTVYWGQSSKEAGYTGNHWIAFARKAEITPGKNYTFEQLNMLIGATA